ncbi:MAG: molybdopterin adenylyltransferase [Proteobacteria bacterium]|nr:molybdopterin adenylyltransferase [Pseudomonadota bacterium]
MSTTRIGIIVSSDRAHAGLYQDLGGPAIIAYLDEVMASPFETRSQIVPDEQSAISEAIVTLSDHDGCALVLTTGGTGPAPRDVTPEATRAVIDRELPGFGEAMRVASLREVPTAILSRQIAGTRGQTLIINLPGKPSSIRTCMMAVFPAVPYCIDLLGGPQLETRPEICLAFRPGK